MDEDDMSNRAKPPKIVISGYYGFDNCGDEAVALSIIHCLRKLRPDVRITVLSANPDKTRKAYDVDAANRWSPVAIAREIISCQLLISGGGSLIQDVTSVRSPGYYLGIIRMALFFRKKVMIYSQGVGPLNNRKNRMSAARVFNRCHAITLRDSASAELLRDIGVEQDMVVTCDPVMALSREDSVNTLASQKGLLREFGISDSAGGTPRPLLFVSIRCWKENRHIEPVAKLLDMQAAKGWDVLLVPAHYPEDMDALSMLSDRMTTQPYIAGKCLNAVEFIALAASADKVFSMRLHGLICAMAMGTPMIGLSYDPKIDAFMEQAGMERFCLSLENIDFEAAKRIIDEQPPPLEPRRLEMRKLAWDTSERAIALLS